MSQTPLRIGPYTVGMPASSYSNLKKLSWFNPFDIKRPKARGVTRYEGSEPVDFCGKPRKVIIGVVGESVWSLSVAFYYEAEKPMAESLSQLVEHYKRVLGEHTSDKDYPIKWIGAFGSVTFTVQSMTSVANPLYYFTLTMSAG